MLISSQLVSNNGEALPYYYSIEEQIGPRGLFAESTFPHSGESLSQMTSQKRQ